MEEKRDKPDSYEPERPCAEIKHSEGRPAGGEPGRGVHQPYRQGPAPGEPGCLPVPEGEPQPSIARQKPLFGGEFAPPEEKPEPLPRARPEQKSLFKVKNFSRSEFRAQGLKGFDNINAWLSKVQPFVEKGYVIEYGHEGGRNGWARVVKIKKPGKGRLISKAAAPGFSKPEPVQRRLLGEPEELGHSRVNGSSVEEVSS